MSDRLDRIRAALAQEHLDGLFISAPVDDMFGNHDENREYVSGFMGSTGYALVTTEQAVFAADFRYVEQAARECEPRGFTVFPALKGKKDWFPQF
ncbi:MAG: aminopeptidase P family N-terminal domain-containing protein, partial [Tepidiformaceae bacterium]